MRASQHCSRTPRWRSGWMFARNTIEALREASESFGSKSAKTFSCVSIVCATCMSSS